MITKTKTGTKKAMLFLLIFSLVFTCLTIPKIRTQAEGSSIKDLQKQINDKKDSLNASASKRKEIENKIASLKTQQAAAENNKRHYDDLVATIEGEIKDTEELIDFYTELQEQEEAEIDLKQAEYEKSYDAFLKMLKFAYEEGDVNYISLLLDSENFTDFLSRVDIISTIVEYNKNVIARLQEDKANLETIKESHEEIKNQLASYVKDLSVKSNEAKGLRKEAENFAKQLERDVQTNLAMAKQIEQEDINIQAEINRASKELKALQEAERKYVGGTMKLPVKPKYSYVYSSYFGNRKSPITGNYEFHNGVDIPANYGSPIWASNDGIIIIRTYSAGYGNYVVIDHGGGKTTLYAHASSFSSAFKVGDKVIKGDTIAYVGSTGWSTGDHLHFAYAENGVFKDPIASGILS